MAKKKREFSTPELLKSISKIYGFEDKLYAFEIQDFLTNFLGEEHSKEIGSINFKNGNIILRIKSPLFRQDCQMKQSFILKKIQTHFPKVISLQIL